MGEDLSSLRNESSVLHRYIQSILKITRIESKDFKINKDSIDINQLIEQVIKQLKSAADDKGLTLEVNLEPLFLIEADSVLIQEVIVNLIENAIKYSPKGKTIKILSSEVEDKIIFMVEDEGEGISKEDQRKVFQKFYRSKSNEMMVDGSGLGLYLVKYFIELHSGEVFLQSQIGEGTTIGFSLPLENS